MKFFVLGPAFTADNADFYLVKKGNGKIFVFRNSEFECTVGQSDTIFISLLLCFVRLLCLARTNIVCELRIADCELRGGAV